jgi:hypothetical protein
MFQFVRLAPVFALSALFLQPTAPAAKLVPTFTTLAAIRAVPSTLTHLLPISASPACSPTVQFAMILHAHNA